MKHFLILLYLIVIGTAAKAQNLVPNYSFEEADSCPVSGNYRTYKYSLGCLDWGQATFGTVDYYNACDTAAASIGTIVPFAGVPNNVWGHQAAFSGSAYTGFAMYDSGLTYYKEYLIASISPLKVDSAYKVSIEVSLADSSRFATDGMGVLFTTYGSPSQNTDTTLIETPQVDYTSFGIISDTVNWVTLTKTFIADSAYSNMIIGGFKKAQNMNIISFNNNSFKNVPYASYYYLDNVVVEEISSSAVKTLNPNIEITIKPNPFSNYTIFIINNLNNINYTLCIYNIQGQIVQIIGNISQDKVKIERNNLALGLYYYKLYAENKIAAIGKMIIN